MLRCKLLLMLIMTGGALAQAPSPAETAALLDEWVPQKLEEYRIPGAVVAVVDVDWESPLLVGYGHADLENDRPMDPVQSLLRVGSVSKALTATLALIAEQQGVLELDEDLVPLFADLPLERRPGETISAHDLLVFTGGFDEELFGQHFRTAEAYPGLAGFLEQRLPPRFERSGVVSSYNDFQTSLVGYAIERRAGKTFEAFGAEQLLGPLGMNDSTFEQVAVPRELIERRAYAYELRDGHFVPYERDYIATTPAAGLYTTAADMARYLKALLGTHPDRGRVLAPGAWDRHLQRQFAHLPELYAWGYGFAQDRRRGFEIWFKDGQATGFHARMLLVPELGLGIFSAINRNIIGPAGNMHDAVRFNRELGDLILEELHAERANRLTVPEPEPGFEQGAAPYVGTYRTTVQSRHTPERLITMFDDITVGAEGDYLTLGSGRWAEVRPGLAQWHEGGPHYMGFGELEDGQYRYLFLGRGSYERVPWYGASWATPWFAGTFALAASLGLLVGGLLYWRRRTLLPGLILLHGLLQFGFFLGLGLIFGRSDLQQLFFGLPPSLQLVLCLPVLALVVMAAVSWRLVTDRPRMGAAIFACAYVLVSLAAAAWIAYWQLLGPDLSG